MEDLIVNGGEAGKKGRERAQEKSRKDDSSDRVKRLLPAACARRYRREPLPFVSVPGHGTVTKWLPAEQPPNLGAFNLCTFV